MSRRDEARREEMALLYDRGPGRKIDPGPMLPAARETQLAALRRVREQIRAANGLPTKGTAGADESSATRRAG